MYKAIHDNKNAGVQQQAVRIVPGQYSILHTGIKNRVAKKHRENQFIRCYVNQPAQLHYKKVQYGLIFKTVPDV